MNKSKAFTLAEILIVIGVIGIIAMLTVPRVMKNYRNMLYVAQLRKVYAQLSDAIQTSMVEEKASDFYETKGGQFANACGLVRTCGPEYFLEKYLSPINTGCTTDCYPASYTTLSGKTKSFLPDALRGESEPYCVQLKSGATICMFKTYQSFFFIDVNGTKAPNVAGRDVFFMIVNTNGTLSDFENAAKCSINGAEGCLNKIMDAGWRMEY